MVVEVTLLCVRPHHATSSVIIFLKPHALWCFNPYIALLYTLNRFHFGKGVYMMVPFCDRPFQNISEFDDQDGCGSDSWMMVDVDSPQDQNRNPEVLLSGLKPVTQYAIFLKTVTLVVEDIDTHVLGAKSKLVYILTKPKGKEGMQTLLQNDITVCEMV